jgi:hypothetical protein
MPKIFAGTGFQQLQRHCCLDLEPLQLPRFRRSKRPLSRASVDWVPSRAFFDKLRGDPSRQQCCALTQQQAKLPQLNSMPLGRHSHRPHNKLDTLPILQLHIKGSSDCLVTRKGQIYSSTTLLTSLPFESSGHRSLAGGVGWHCL